MDKPLADVLAESRKYIEEHGWIRGQLRDREGRVCSLGGVVYSQGWTKKAGEVDGIDTVAHGSDIQTVSTAVLAAVGVDYNKMETPTNHYPGQRLTLWNDNHIEDKQQILDAFAKAEKIARAGYDPDA